MFAAVLSIGVAVGARWIVTWGGQVSVFLNKQQHNICLGIPTNNTAEHLRKEPSQRTSSPAITSADATSNCVDHEVKVKKEGLWEHDL